MSSERTPVKDRELLRRCRVLVALQALCRRLIGAMLLPSLLDWLLSRLTALISSVLLSVFLLIFGRKILSYEMLY